MLDDSSSDDPVILLEVEGQAQTTPLEPKTPRTTPLALVADDDRTMRLFVSRVLSGCGVEVVEAENGKEALDLYEQLRGELSLVVLDLIMPVMGGEQVLAEIRTTDSETQVLMVSGEVDPDTRQQLLDSGATAFLAKPLDTVSLTTTVRQLLPAARANPP